MQNFEPPEPSWDPPEPPAAAIVADPPEPASPAIVGEIVVDDPPPPAAVTRAPQSQEEEIATRANQIVARAQALKIVDAASFQQADEMLATLKEQKKRIEEFFADDIRRAHAAWQGLCQKRKAYTDPLDEAITVVAGRYYAFKKEEERKAAEERRRREEEARKAEEERLRKEAEERAAEAKRLEEEAMKAPSRDVAQELEARAEETKAAAEQLTLAAATVQAPVIPVSSQVLDTKTKNSTRENWTCEVTNKADLIKAVAAGKVSIEALEPNMVYLRARAKADKATCNIPGVRCYDAGSVAAGRARKR